MQHTSIEAKPEARRGTSETEARLSFRKMAYSHIKPFILLDNFNVDQLKLLLGQLPASAQKEIRISDLFYEAINDQKGSIEILKTIARLGIKEIEQYGDMDPDTAAVKKIEKGIFSNYLHSAAGYRKKHQ